MRDDSRVHDYMIHDVRVQAQLMLGNIDWILRVAGQSPIVAGGLDVTDTCVSMQENIQVACRLLDSMLLPEDGEPYCELRPLIERIVVTISQNAKAVGRQCGYEMQGDPAVKSVPALMERMLYNLLSNAIRHTPENTLIQLKVSPADEGVRIAVISEGPSLGACEVCVLEKAESLECDEIRGMGLRIVRSLADKMHCDLHFSRVEGRNVIEVTVPAVV